MKILTVFTGSPQRLLTTPKNDGKMTLGKSWQKGLNDSQ